MATAKPNIPGRPRRWKARMVLWTMLLAGALLAWFWKPLHADATLLAAESARLACPCRFAAGRDMASCRGDFRHRLNPVIMSEDAGTKSVTAWVPLLSRQTATYHKGQGCVLERWQD